MVGWLLSLFPHRDRVTTFVDGFGGAAAVLLAVDPPYPVEVYNDADQELSRFFKACRDRPEELASLIALTPYSLADWTDAKRTIEEAGGEDELERARLFGLVARQSMGGAWGRAWSSVVGHSRRGMASGNSRWLHLPEDILAVAGRLAQVQIEERPFLGIVKKYDRPGTLFYLDPPYLPGTCADGVYRCTMTQKHHIAMLERLRDCQGMVALSAYRNAIYDELLHDWHRVDREFTCRSNVNSIGGTAKKPKRIESVYTNYNVLTLRSPPHGTRLESGTATAAQDDG